MDFCRYLQSKGPGFYHYTLKALSNQYAPQEFTEPGAYHSITKGLGPSKEIENIVRCIVATPVLCTLDCDNSVLHKTDSVSYMTT